MLTTKAIDTTGADLIILNMCFGEKKTRKEVLKMADEFIRDGYTLTGRGKMWAVFKENPSGISSGHHFTLTPPTQ